MVRISNFRPMALRISLSGELPLNVQEVLFKLKSLIFTKTYKPS